MSSAWCDAHVRVFVEDDARVEQKLLHDGAMLRRVSIIRGRAGLLVGGSSRTRRTCGSKRRFTSHMSSYALVPHSISTNGATLRPVPCSALSEPPYLSAT